MVSELHQKVPTKMHRQLFSTSIVRVLYNNHHTTIIMNSIQLSRSLRRLDRLQLLKNTRLSQSRCFSCSIRVQQQQTASKASPKDESERYTHFGFETVAEQLKQGKGNSIINLCYSSVLIQPDSERSLFLCRLLV
jgi:hypothetical protein